MSDPIPAQRLFKYKVAATSRGDIEIRCDDCARTLGLEPWSLPIWTTARRTAIDGGFDFSIMEFVNVVIDHEGLVHSGKDEHE